MRRLHATLAILTCAILSASGCELREYEARMDVQRERIKMLDEENDTITSSAIDMPMIAATTKDGTATPAWPFAIFLRLPRVMGTVPVPTAYVSTAQDLRLIRYGAANPDYNLFVAAALVADAPSKDGKPRPGEFTPGVFLDRVRGALLDYYRKAYQVTPVEFPLFDLSAKAKNGEPLFKKFTKHPTTDHGEALPPIDYEAIAFRDDRSRPKEPSIFQLYYYRRDTRQVAIVVQFPASRAGDPQITRAVDLSLTSLDVSVVGIAAKRSALMSRRR